MDWVVFCNGADGVRWYWNGKRRSFSKYKFNAQLYASKKAAQKAAGKLSEGNKTVTYGIGN